MSVKVLLENPSTGTTKEVPHGFSWETLFFGPLVPLFRGDWKWFFYMVIIDGISLILSKGILPDYLPLTQKNPSLSFIGIGIPWIFFAFVYNKFYIKRLISRGFKIKGYKSELLPSKKEYTLTIDEEKQIREALNKETKVPFLGDLIDINWTKYTKVTFLDLKKIIVIRETETKESPGQNLPEIELPSDPYEHEFNMPEDPLNIKKEPKVGIIFVRTYECEPYITCNKCNGTGTCPTCHGTGWITCSRCHGSGHYYDEFEKKIKKCPVCNGTGRERCHDCGGTGKCSKCNGTGKLICKRCMGTGYYQKIKTFKTTYKITEKSYNFGLEGLPIRMQSWIKSKKGKGKIVFKGKLIEFSNRDKISYKSDFLEKDSSKIDEEVFSKVKDELLSFLKPKRGKPGRLELTIEEFDILHLNYTYNQKIFDIYYNKQANSFFAFRLPKPIQKELGQKFGLLGLKRKNLEKAYLATAIYMAWADGKIQEEEERILKQFLYRTTKLKKERKKFQRYIQNGISFEELKNYLRPIKKDRTPLILAWQIALADKKIEPSEYEHFQKLLTFYKVNVDELEAIKNMAKLYERIRISEIVNAYLGKSLKEESKDKGGEE